MIIKSYINRTSLKKTALFIGCTLLIFLLLDVIFPFKPNVQYSTQITTKDGVVLHAFLSRDDKWRLYTNNDEITPLLRKTLIYKEDQYFYYHPGINPFAIARAAVRNIFTGRRTSGASTITMQVVRLLQPKRRTYYNKILEAFRAFQLELHYSKEEIVQLYFNLVPYGGNIEGIKAASLLYFGKPPQLLSLAEITALTIVPNRPSSLRPGTQNEALVAARNEWLRRFGKEKLFEENVINDALSEPLNIKRRSSSKLAPHLSLRLQKDFPNQPIIETSRAELNVR